MSDDFSSPLCPNHLQEIQVFLLYTSFNNPADNPSPFHGCCQDCLMEIPSSYRNGTPCLFIQDIFRFFQKALRPFAKQQKANPMRSDPSQVFQLNKQQFSPLIEYYSNVLTKRNIDQNIFLSALQNMLRTYKQKITLVPQGKLQIGSSDFASESCAYVPDRQLLFIGNRIGELYVIQKQSKKVIRKIACPNRIAAVKYIPEKKSIIVTGLDMFIMKVNTETFETKKMLKSPPSPTFQSGITVEYLKTQNLLLLGGFRADHSIELYNFNDLSLEKSINFLIKNNPDEVWASLAFESGGLILLGYQSGALQLWRSSKTFHMTYATQTGSSVTSIEYQETKKIIYSGHRSGEIGVWGIKTSRLYKIKYINTNLITVTKIKFLHKPFSNYFIVSDFGKKLSLWDHVGHKIDVSNELEEPSRSILVLDNEAIISTGMTPGGVFLYTAKSVQRPREMIVPCGSYSSLQRESLDNVRDVLL